MNSSVLVLVLAALACANAGSVYYAGSTLNSPTSGNPPTFTGSGSACAAGAAASPYEAATVNISATNFYWVTAMFEDGTISDAEVSIYPTGTNGFVPATPCANLVASAGSQSGGAPHLYAPVYLTAGLYTFVVTTTDAANAGIFSFHVDPANFWGNTATGHFWNPPSYDTYPCSTDTGYTAAYTSYTWVQAATGYYDINVVLQNATLSAGTSFYMRSALYNGTVPFLGTGSDATPADGCAGAAFVWGIQDDNGLTRLSTGFGQAGVFGTQWLVAGVNYTVVVSSDTDTDFGNVGIRVSPTVYHQIGSTANFDIPSLGTDPTACTAGDTAKVWRPTIFTVIFPTYVVDTGPTDVGFDSISALYIGNNAGSADQTVAPSPCTGFLQVIDTGDVGPLSATGLLPGHNYTIIVSTYSSSTPSDPWYTLYVYSGTQLGALPPVPTTGVPVATTTAGKHSAASNVVASFVVVLLAAIAALF